MQVASEHTEPQTPDIPHPTQGKAQSPSLSGSDSSSPEALPSGSATAVDPQSEEETDAKGARKLCDACIKPAVLYKDAIVCFGSFKAQRQFLRKGLS